MFDVTEYRVIPADPKSLEGTLPGVAYNAAGMQLQATMPLVWQGKGQAGSYGFQPSIVVRAAPTQGGTSVEIRLGAEIESSWIAIYIVMVLLFWPIALILGYMGYDEFQKKRTMMFQGIWQNLGGPQQQPSGYGVGAPPGGPPAGGFSGHFG
jgi:hypothetical protein